MSLKRRRRVVWLFDRNGYPVCCRLRLVHCHCCNVIMSKDDPSRYPTLDHVIPRSRGGTNRRNNLVPACHQCNQRKGQRTAAEFIAAGL